MDRNIKEQIKNILYADNIIGYFVFLFAVAVIVIILSLKFGLNAMDKTPQWFNDIINNGGIPLIIGCSMIVAFVLGERVFRRSESLIELFMPKGLFGQRTVRGKGEFWDNHPYYVTGSNENTKTVSDNYLPTL